ncbi:hypothetical protein Taro_052978 [Colocasia esculenta]|uniref:cytidine deaminase n=1 Tax=Colocasia esculenta TaxID=4460 RepID=A0A843XJQ2_COLES|nr:hypothetical protein [Colocasia esculenta]
MATGTAPKAAPFVIGAADAASMAKKAGLASPDLLPTLVPTAMALARPPISNFRVGAVGLGSSGRIYFGANLEFPGTPLNQSVHAEQFLLANAAAHGESRITHVAVSSLPCGHCRQFFQEVRGAPEIQILVTADGPGAAFRPLGELLPHPFGPRDLLTEDAPLLLERHDNHLVLEEGEDGGGGGGAACNGAGEFEERLIAAALEGARRAHAPYSGCPSGFAVGDEDGNVYGGSYAESAAYNPSFAPMQAALASCVAAGGSYGKIVAAALVEKGGAAVSHEGVARLLMAAVAPACRVSVHHCRAGSSSSSSL